MNDITLYTQIPSPIGQLLLEGNEQALQGLYMAPAAPRLGWRSAREPRGGWDALPKSARCGSNR